MKYERKINVQHINSRNKSYSFKSVSLKPLALLLLVLCSLSAGMAASATITEDDIYKVFTEYNIEYDTNVIHSGIIASMLHSVDSRACLLNSNDISRLNNLVSIESTELLGENIGYIKIRGLYRDAGEKVCDELKCCTEKQIFGEIMDLRSAGGNNLQSVNSIINLFVMSNTPLYKVQSNSGDIIASYSSPSNNIPNNYRPLMVLVDENTVDASVLLAALLKGHDGVMLIGTKTGKLRRLMEVIPFSEDESLYIATRNIMPIDTGSSYTNGIMPDIVVTIKTDKKSDLAVSGKIMIGKNISKKAEMDRKLMERVVDDAVLQRATDILLALKALETVNSE